MPAGEGIPHRRKQWSGSSQSLGLTTVQLVQSLELVVHGDQLITDVGGVIDPGKIIQHRLDLRLAGNEDAA